MSHVEQGFTKIPNTLLSMIPLMADAELKVVLALARKTYGWHKESDAISLSQFQKMTGLSRQSVITGLRFAIERGILQEVRTGKRGIKAYRLMIIVGQSEETGEIFRPVIEPTGLNSRPVSDATSLEFRPVNDATGLNFSPTKDKDKQRKEEDKNEVLEFSDFNVVVDETVPQVQPKTEITPAQIFVALVKINVRIPARVEREKEDYLKTVIQIHGGDLIMEAVEHIRRHYPRRNWDLFEDTVHKLAKEHWRKRY